VSERLTDIITDRLRNIIMLSDETIFIKTSLNNDTICKYLNQMEEILNYTLLAI
jgi:hypothetical protein